MTAAPAPGLVPALVVEDVDLFYGDAQALAGVSLEVPRGAIVAIVGANGAGKSSLIHAIAGLEAARSGRIVFDGREIQALEPHEICNLGIGQGWRRNRRVGDHRPRFPRLRSSEY